MKIMVRARQSGKTIKLIEMSAKTQIPIMCYNMQRRDSIKDMARQMRVDIPEPITWRTHNLENT